MTSPLVSFHALNNDGSLVAELGLPGFNLDMYYYMTGEKLIKMSAYTLYALHDEDKSTITKKIIIAPIDSKMEIITGKEFYSKISKKSKAQREQSREVQIEIEIKPDYEKIWSVNFNNQKIFLKYHIFMLLSNFFIQGLPNYEEIEDKPYGCNQNK